MANYCIMRVKKLKTNANVGASIQHALRIRDTPNANEELTNRNWCNISGAPEQQLQKAMSLYKSKLPSKVRKNGVRAVELMMTASPDSKIDSKYLNACDAWAREKFGKENVFFICHHYDETTPHTSIILVPRDEKGNLNCRHYLGGRDKLIALQDSFYESVGKKFGLARGERGSRATHETIKQFYSRAERLEQAIEPPTKRIFESSASYKERYKQQIAPVVAVALQAKKNELANEYHVEHEKKALESQKKALESDFNKKIEKRVDEIIKPTLERDFALMKQNKELAKKAKKFEYWRELSPERLHQIANDIQSRGLKNANELKKQIELEEKKRDSGWSR